MIITTLLGIISGVFHLVVSAVPLPTVPTWLTQSGSAFNAVLYNAYSMSAWFPLSLAIQIAGVLLACQVGGGLIKIGRILMSFFTAGGGSAG